jgi:hypothetical protein
LEKTCDAGRNKKVKKQSLWESLKFLSNPLQKLTNSLIYGITAGVDNDHFPISYVLSPLVVGVPIHFLRLADSTALLLGLHWRNSPVAIGIPKMKHWLLSNNLELIFSPWNQEQQNIQPIGKKENEWEKVQTDSGWSDRVEKKIGERKVELGTYTKKRELVSVYSGLLKNFDSKKIQCSRTILKTA